MTHSVKIPTTHSAFLTTTSSVKVSASDCDNDVSHVTTGYCTISAKAVVISFPAPTPGKWSLWHYCLNTHLSSLPWPKPSDMLLEFDPISGFGGHIALSGCRSLSRRLDTLSSSSPWSKALDQTLEIDFIGMAVYVIIISGDRYISGC